MKVHIGIHKFLHYAYIFGTECYLVINISNLNVNYYKNREGYEFYKDNSSIILPEDIDFILDSFSERFDTEKLLSCLRMLIAKKNNKKYESMLKSAVDYIENVLKRQI